MSGHWRWGWVQGIDMPPEMDFEGEHLPDEQKDLIQELSGGDRMMSTIQFSHGGQYCGVGDSVGQITVLATDMIQQDTIASSREIRLPTTSPTLPSHQIPLTARPSTTPTTPRSQQQQRRPQPTITSPRNTNTSPRSPRSRIASPDSAESDPRVPPNNRRTKVSSSASFARSTASSRLRSPSIDGVLQSQQQLDDGDDVDEDTNNNDSNNNNSVDQSSPRGGLAGNLSSRRRHSATGVFLGKKSKSSRSSFQNGSGGSGGAADTNEDTDPEDTNDVENESVTSGGTGSTEISAGSGGGAGGGAGGLFKRVATARKGLFRNGSSKSKVMEPLSSRRLATQVAISSFPTEGERLRLANRFAFKTFIPECDVLTSTLIHPQVCEIEWLPFAQHPTFLVANGKYVKMMRIRNPEGLKRSPLVWQSKQKPSLSTHETAPVPEFGENQTSTNNEDTSIPRLSLEGSWKTISSQNATKRTFIEPTNPPNLHSVSLSTDQENFLTASERFIHLWNVNYEHRSLKLIDPDPEVSPLMPVDPTLLLTSAKFHPQHAHIFAFANGGGASFIADQRESTDTENYAKKLRDVANMTPLPMRAISDLSFSQDGRYVLTRDVLALRIWDLNNEVRPIETLWLNRELKSVLLPQFAAYPLAYSFRCGFSNDSRLIFTGNFNNTVFLHDRRNASSTFLPVTPSQPSQKNIVEHLTLSNKASSTSHHNRNGKNRASMPVLCQAFHPSLDVLVAPYGGEKLVLYSGKAEKYW